MKRYFPSIASGEDFSQVFFPFHVLDSFFNDSMVYPLDNIADDLPEGEYWLVKIYGSTRKSHCRKSV